MLQTLNSEITKTPGGILMPQAGKIISSVQEAVVLIMVTANGGLLFEERGEDTHEGPCLALPGGIMELEDKHPSIAAIREISEELGIDVGLDQLFSFGQDFSALRGIIKHFFYVHLTEQNWRNMYAKEGQKLHVLSPQEIKNYDGIYCPEKVMSQRSNTADLLNHMRI